MIASPLSALCEQAVALHPGAEGLPGVGVLVAEGLLGVAGAASGMTLPQQRALEGAAELGIGRREDRGRGAGIAGRGALAARQRLQERAQQRAVVAGLADAHGDHELAVARHAERLDLQHVRAPVVLGERHARRSPSWRRASRRRRLARRARSGSPPRGTCLTAAGRELGARRARSRAPRCDERSRRRPRSCAATAPATLG